MWRAMDWASSLRIFWATSGTAPSTGPRYLGFGTRNLESAHQRCRQLAPGTLPRALRSGRASIVVLNAADLNIAAFDRSNS
jgi:hypothetical protein